MNKTIKVTVDDLFLSIYANQPNVREFYDLHKEEHNFIFHMHGQTCIGYKIAKRRANQTSPTVTFVYPTNLNLDTIIRKNITKGNFIENITRIIEIKGYKILGDINQICIGNYYIAEVNGKDCLVIGTINKEVEKDEIELLPEPVEYVKGEPQHKFFQERESSIQPNITFNQVVSHIEKIEEVKEEKRLIPEIEEMRMVSHYVRDDIEFVPREANIKSVRYLDNLLPELFYSYNDYLRQQEQCEQNGAIDEDFKNGSSGLSPANDYVYEAKIDVAEWCMDNFRFPKSKVSKFDTLRFLWSNQHININLHEIIKGPANLYCDIDSDNEEEFNYTYNTIISEKFKKYFISVYSALAKQIINCRFEVNPVKSTHQEIKFSAHIYIRIFVEDEGFEYRMTFDDQKLFWEMATKDLKINVDMAVYKKNARLRTIFSAKEETILYKANVDDFYETKKTIYRSFIPQIDNERDLLKYIIADEDNSIPLPDLKESMTKMCDFEKNMLKIQLKQKCITRHEYYRGEKKINDSEKNRNINFELENFKILNLKQKQKKKEVNVVDKNGEPVFDINGKQMKRRITMKDILEAEKWTEYEIERIDEVIEKSTLYKSHKQLGKIIYDKTVKILFLTYLRYTNIDIAEKIVNFFSKKGFTTTKDETETRNFVQYLTDRKYNDHITYNTIRKHLEPVFAKTVIHHNECIYPPNTKKSITVCRAFCNMKKTVNLFLAAAGHNIYQNVPESILKQMFGDMPIHNEPKRVCVVTSRKLLGMNMLQNTCGVNFTFYEDYKQGDKVPEHFIVQLESLARFKFIDQYDIIFIDEAPHFINQFCHQKEKHGQYFSDMEGIFRRMFQNQSIVFSSANINHDVYNFINLFGQKVDYDFFFDVKVRAGWKVKNYQIQTDLNNKIVKWLASGENLFIGSFTKKYAKILKEFILSTDPYSILPREDVKSKPLTEDDILMINSEEREKNQIIFKDINNNFKKRVVIFTGSMGVGVSFTEEWFHRNIVFCVNYLGPTSDDAYQMAFRNRNPITKKVYINMKLSNIGYKPKFDIEKRILYLECPYSQKFLLEDEHYQKAKTEGIMNKVYLNNKMNTGWDLMNFYGNLRCKFEEEGFAWQNKRTTTTAEEILAMKLKCQALEYDIKFKLERNLLEYFNEEDCQWKYEDKPFNREYTILRQNYSEQEVEALRRYYIDIFHQIKDKQGFFRSIVNNELIQSTYDTLQKYGITYKYSKKLEEKLSNQDEYCHCEKQCRRIDCEEFGVKIYLPACQVLPCLDEKNLQIYTIRSSLPNEIKIIAKFLCTVPWRTKMFHIRRKYFNILDTIEFAKKRGAIGEKKKMGLDTKDQYVLQSINKYLEKVFFKVHNIGGNIVIRNNIREILGCSINIKQISDVDYDKVEVQKLYKDFYNLYRDRCPKLEEESDMPN